MTSLSILHGNTKRLTSWSIALAHGGELACRWSIRCLSRKTLPLPCIAFRSRPRHDELQQFDVGQMKGFLTASLGRGLPAGAAQRQMAHRLAYGRHHGPIPDDSRWAAVLIALHPTPEGWSIPAILRPDTMKAHAGQVSLPGGLIEADETVSQTALREFEEELGTAAAELQVVGQLSPIYVFVSGFEVTPLIAISSND